MALNFILKDIKSILVNAGYSGGEIILQTANYQTSQNTSLQNAIFLISESSPVSMDSYISTDFALYVRRPDPEQANTVSQDIYHTLHQKRGNVGLVSANYAKLDLIMALTQPYPYSVITTGGNVTEFVTKYRVNYIDTDFENY